MHEKPSKLMPALYGGLIIGVISGIPFLSFINCLCCAGVIFGGVMAVFFYKKDLTPQMPPLSNNDAIAVGAIAGLFGALFSNILGAVLLYTIGNVAGEATYEAMMGLYENMGLLDSMPPEALEQMEEGMMEGGLSAVSVITSFVIFPLFGLLGGLIGYAIFKPKATTTPQTPVQQA